MEPGVDLALFPPLHFTNPNHSSLHALYKRSKTELQGAPTLSSWAQPALLPWSEAHQHNPSLPSGENSPVSVI